jgi:hypothetical protein
MLAGYELPARVLLLGRDAATVGGGRRQSVTEEQGMSRDSSAADRLSTVQASDDGREVIYVLRTAQQHQVQLSHMADQKANIIIGLALIYFSVVGSRLAGGLVVDERYLLPLGSLSLMIFLAFFAAVLVVIPRARTRVYKNPEEMPNPLFFGFFASCPEERYTRYLLERLADNYAARELIVRDLHQIGVVLLRKYRLLKYAYGLLSLGMLASGMLLVIELLSGG